MRDFLAQAVPLGSINSYGPLGNFERGPDNYYYAFTRTEVLISSLIGLLTIIGALWFLFQIIIAGLQWIGASGEKATVQSSQKRLIFSVLGLLVIVASYALLGLMGSFFGLDIFNFHVTFARIVNPNP